MGDAADDAGQGRPTGLRRGLAAAVGFVVAGAVAGTVTAATGSADPVPAAPVATRPAGPTDVDVRVHSATQVADSPTMLRLALSNEGVPVRVLRAGVEGPGYEPTEGYLEQEAGLGTDAEAALHVALLPTCGAGVGAPRRPELVLELRTSTGARQVTRTALTRGLGVPDRLIGSCAAPLGTGAEVVVTPLRQVAVNHLRLRLTLSAGRGELWVSDLHVPGLGAVSPPVPLPVIVAPGERRVLDLDLLVGDCAALQQSTPDPLNAQLVIRGEPAAGSRVVLFAEAGGQPYLRAVGAAIARACP